MQVLLIKVTIFFLFFPAFSGLGIRLFEGRDLSYRLLCLGLMLFCIEQCRMAIVDLTDYFLAKTQCNSYRLSSYFNVLRITIALELVGFYYCFFALNIGSIIVLLSQVWFNSLARIKITTKNNQILVTPWGVKKRIGELLGAFLGITLVTLWTINFYPLLMGFFMLSMMVIFMILKYLLPLLKTTFRK